MKKLLIPLMGLLFAGALVVNAQDTAPAPKHAKRQLTAEQKAVEKDLLAKYDTNKNGKLEKKERAKITKEDREKAEKVGYFKKAAPGKAGAPKAKVNVKKTEKTTPSTPQIPSTNSPSTDKK
jgi:hypothetical protein